MTATAHRMRDFDAALHEIQYTIKRRLELRASLNELLSTGLNQAMQEEERQRILQEDDRARNKVLRILSEIVSFPPKHHGRHNDALSRFWREAGFDRSVFIMTKFPRPAHDPGREARDQELDSVIDAVRSAVRTAGFAPRIATTAYHELLWDNVELHLLGCGQGIAIVEDRYLTELNPNVVMEWGWMRAMGRPVLYLVEKEFKKFRADLDGLLKEPFSWADPVPGVAVAVDKFLTEQLKP